jgi:hypothetical protein
MDPIKIKDGRTEMRSLNNSEYAIYKLDKGFRVDAVVGPGKGVRLLRREIWGVGPTIILSVFRWRRF